MTAPDARRLAWRALMSWEQGEVALLEQALRLAGVERGRDAGLARELALGAVRYRRLYDALCQPYLRGDDQPLALRVTLRIAAHQLFALDRIPAHAAVGRSVGCLGGEDRRLRGVANAVSRRLAELRLPEREPSRQGPLGRLPEHVIPADPAVRYSLPEALVADLQPVLPGDQDSALAALNRLPPLCTRSRPGQQVVDHPAIIRRDGPWTWWSDPQAALRQAVDPGLAVVQDRTQGRLLELAAPRPGALVADCCAAPGGKARWLLDHGCRVVAGEIATSKLSRLGHGPGGLPAVLRHDARQPGLAGGFELVVVDVPCSNSGVLARRPEARWRYDQTHLQSLESLQSEILHGVLPLVAAGGRLLYTTCSLSPRENRDRVAAVAGWSVVAEHLQWPDGWGGGGYAAVLERDRPAASSST